MGILLNQIIRKNLKNIEFILKVETHRADTFPTMQFLRAINTLWHACSYARHTNVHAI